MGKKLDALLKRSSLKSTKFKPLVNLALHRLAVLKSHRQVRCNIAKSDVVEILNLGLHDRALLRVEHVIKEQNMLDVLVMIEGYCNLVLERFHLIELEKSCPDELKEAISSLLYASSRCGEFPELQEIRAAFTSHYGKEFTARAIELRNNCGVSTTLIQKLSTRMPSLESRMRVLKQIADDKSIALELAEYSFEKQAETEPLVAHVASPKAEDDRVDEERDRYFGSPKGKKYENAADAAQAAFESAAYAAQAARAAVELSRGDSHDSEGSSSPYPRRRKLSDQQENTTFRAQIIDNDKVSSIKEDDTFSFKDSTTGQEDSNTVDTSKLENQTIYVKYHTNKMEHNTATSDPLMTGTYDQAEAGNSSQDMYVPEDCAPEESWFRRGWNSNKEKMKRPFLHRSRGVAVL